MTWSSSSHIQLKQHDKVEAAPGAGQGQPRGLGGAGRGPQAPSRRAKPRQRKLGEAAILQHCAASRRGHREPSILPKTHIPAQINPTESLFLLWSKYPHTRPLLSICSGFHWKNNGQRFVYYKPPPHLMAPPGTSPITKTKGSPPSKKGATGVV